MKINYYVNSDRVEFYFIVKDHIHQINLHFNMDEFVYNWNLNLPKIPIYGFINKKEEQKQVMKKNKQKINRIASKKRIVKIGFNG